MPVWYAGCGPVRVGGEKEAMRARGVLMCGLRVLLGGVGCIWVAGSWACYRMACDGVGFTVLMLSKRN